MSNFRKILIERMLLLYCREPKIIADFIDMCETLPEIDDKCLEVLVDCHEKSPIIDEN